MRDADERCRHRDDDMGDHTCSTGDDGWWHMCGKLEESKPKGTVLQQRVIQGFEDMWRVTIHLLPTFRNATMM